MMKEVLNTAEEKTGKRAYSKPQIIEYGRVEELTQGASGPNKDFGSQQP